MLQTEEHTFGQTGFRQQKDDGSVQTGWVCLACGYRKVQWEFPHFTVKDNFLDDVNEELGIGLPPPTCPPSEAWRGLARRLEKILEVKKPLDCVARANEETGRWIKDRVEEFQAAIDECPKLDSLSAKLGLDEGEELEVPHAVLPEEPVVFTGEEKPYELPPFLFRNLN